METAHDVLSWNTKGDVLQDVHRALLHTIEPYINPWAEKLPFEYVEVQNEVERKNFSKQRPKFQSIIHQGCYR